MDSNRFYIILLKTVDFNPWNFAHCNSRLHFQRSLSLPLVLDGRNHPLKKNVLLEVLVPFKQMQQRHLLFKTLYITSQKPLAELPRKGAQTFKEFFSLVLIFRFWKQILAEVDEYYHLCSNVVLGGSFIFSFRSHSFHVCCFLKSAFILSLTSLYPHAILLSFLIFCIFWLTLLLSGFSYLIFPSFSHLNLHSLF